MEDFTWPIHLRFLVALGLSFLLGLERESSGAETKGKVFAGVRTYSMIGVYGFGCAWLGTIDVGWAFPMGMLSVSGLALAGYVGKLKQGYFGWTSEVAALLTFIMGGMCLLTDLWIPAALGIVGTFLLSEKAKLENFVERLDKTEFLAVLKFLIVTLIVLPVLPDQSYTEYELNPRHIWQIVVLVSSVGFGGYLLTKKFGSKVGLWLSGLLGGIVSSTVVTIAVGRIAQRAPKQGVNALQASLLASSVMYPRILVLIWIINPEFVAAIWWKLTILPAIGLLLSILKRTKIPKREKEHVGTLKNPFEIRPALVFASLFVFLSVVTIVVQKFYGDAGVITLAGIVGVTDIDPFILSVVDQSQLAQKLVTSAILVAMMSNTIVKGVYFSFLVKHMRKQAIWRYAVWAVLHLPLILFI